jgi:hypothetical protein
MTKTELIAAIAEKSDLPKSTSFGSHLFARIVSSNGSSYTGRHVTPRFEAWGATLIATSRQLPPLVRCACRHPLR